MSDPDLRRVPVSVCAALLLIALACLAFWAALAGPFPLSFADLQHAVGSGPALSPAQHSVLLRLRLPRLLAAVAIGGGLAIAGCSFQAVLRNPLADPSFIGVSGGAAVAAAACLASLSHLHFIALPPQILIAISALAGGLGSAALVLRIARVDGDAQPITLLLAGLAINALAGGLLGLIAYSSNDPTLRAITLWLFGSLDRAGWPELAVAAPAILLAALSLWRLAPSLNALLLGEAEAAHVGVHVAAVRRGTIALAVVCTACSVALAGVVGFIGLMVPHMLRMLIGPDHRSLMPLSFLGGAALLTLADTIARIAVQPAEIPVGILCALLGAPFFLGLLLHWRRSPVLS
ncbi:FecCD family ABC transporter permease [Solimonas terrae]|uniref:Iron ABC transporter permease n=1 Tax=Solimonas terrae TaxID=1396819 RepID=A0A6M2BN17_9GAMM|nr:iron ABC transporter permease [Solimonas terrae]NGY03467.1 iron ABC transporter permease [Solimonas terrae]